MNLPTTVDAARKAITENQHIELVAQVDSVCPRCSRQLLGKKSHQLYKRYDVAHIYPLHPTPTEEALLAGEERLSPDPNDLANLIPLCKSCHGEFDKPRTVEEYRELVDYKRHVAQRDEERSLWHKYPLEREITAIVKDLAKHDEDPQANTTFDVKTVESKTRDVSPLPRRKVRSEVRTYFTFVQQLFRQMERSSPGSSALIGQQVRTYYLAQRKHCTEKTDLYFRVARWIQRRSQGSNEAAEVVASFFVQNCEVFE